MSRLSVRREDAAQIFGEESAARRAQGLLLALHLAGQRTLHLLIPLYTTSLSRSGHGRPGPRQDDQPRPEASGLHHGEHQADSGALRACGHSQGLLVPHQYNPPTYISHLLVMFHICEGLNKRFLVDEDDTTDASNLF